MTWEHIIAAVTAIGILLNGLGTMFAWLQSRSNSAKIEEVHKATNSMKDALVASTALASHAAGFAEGQAQRQMASD